MPLTPHDLQLITDQTVGHYDENAREFWEGTRDHDVTQNIDALLSHMSGPPPWRILDFGCGPGRDLLALRQRGHEAVGLEGSTQLAAMARRHSGCEVLQQNFLSLQLPVAHFDGVFANASLFHVPVQELSRVLRELHDALKPGGVLFTSNPRGQGQEGWSGDRYGVFHDLQGWRRQVGGAGFVELMHYLRPSGAPPEEQRWLATVWRRPL